MNGEEARNSSDSTKKPRKSIATTEICDRKVSFSVESELEQLLKLERDRKLSIEPNRITYAEYYLKTKRSGSLALPVSQYSDKQLNELKRIFDLFDFDKDGYLNESDLRKIFIAVDPKLARGDKVRDFIDSANNNESGKITQNEFNQFLGGTYFGRFSRIELRYVFDAMDRNRDGFLDQSDLKRIFQDLGWNEDKFDLKATIDALDFNRDGRVCYEDFKMVMNRGYAPVE